MDTEEKCTCNGARWVCEDHERPACGCGGALRPCACNDDAALPPGWRCHACVD